MMRSILIGFLTAVSLAGASAASAAPVAPNPVDGGAGVIQARYYRDCPPGYKATHYGGCKLSHYMRRHPGRYGQRNYYYAEPRTRYEYRRYEYRRDHHRRYEAESY